MPPQEHIPVAASIIGTIGTICWCIQLVPQIWYNWRRKSTDGLPGTMVFLWSICSPPFGVYAIVQNFNIPIQVQPQFFGVFTLICWGQTLYYHTGWSKWKSIGTVLGTAAIYAAIQVSLIVTLRPIYREGVSWPVDMMGIFAAVMLGIGLLPPYYEIWKRKGRVVGINFTFLSIDFAGAVFSLLSLVLQHTFDLIGGCCYIVCLFLEIGIFGSHIVWRYRHRRERAAAKKAGMSYDDYMDKQNDHSPTSTHTAATSVVTLTPEEDSNRTACDKVDIERGESPITEKGWTSHDTVTSPPVTPHATSEPRLTEPLPTHHR